MTVPGLFIVPVSVSDPESIERLRRMATGKFLSASYPGSYVGAVASTSGKQPVREPGRGAPGRRAIDMGDEGSGPALSN